MPVETSISADGSVLNIVLSGEFDINHSMQIQDVISSFPDSVKLIRLDLEAVSRIDATIFSTLLLLYFEKESNARIELINCSKALVQRLSMAGLDRLMNVRMSTTAMEIQFGEVEIKDSSTDHQ